MRGWAHDLLLWVEPQKTGFSSFILEKEGKRGWRGDICQPENAIYKTKVGCDIQLD